MRWIFEHVPEAWYFTNARNHASLALHAKLGFVEVTRDFSYPNVSFDGGVGVLGRALRVAFTDREASGRAPDPHPKLGTAAPVN
jgi:hypothetical protein